MRGAAAQAMGLLLIGSLLVGAAALVEPSLLVGLLGALLCGWGLARRGLAVRAAHSPGGRAVAVRDRRRAQARRAVPRQRDPDAAGHIRSRAPSGLLPAA